MTILTAPPRNQEYRSLKVNGTRHVVLSRSLKDDRVRLIAELNVPEVTHLVKITCL